MLKRGVIIVFSFLLASCEGAREEVTTSKGETRVSSEQSDNSATKKVLDLTLPSESRADPDEGLSLENQALLPDMFEQKKKAQDVKLGAKLLLDPSNPDYVKSIEGAEVSIEIKTE